MDAAGLARALGAVRSGRQWKCKCVAHEDSAPSMIVFDGREQVQVRCLAGCDQRDLIAELRRRGLWDRDSRHRDDVVTSRRDARAENQRDLVSHETRMMMRARSVFDDAVLCHGTLGQRYLESREIWSVARDLEDIRFHAQCPRAHGVQPALVIAMRSIYSRSIEAVQRIYLTLGGQKDGAMMLGPVGGAAMQLEPRGVSRELHIAEGCESALGVMAMDHWPVWAMGSCGAIERLPVLDGVDHLVIWSDHDRIDPRTGVRPGGRAAEVCAQRWRAADRVVDVYRPLGEGCDPWDVWRDCCGRQ